MSRDAPRLRSEARYRLVAGQAVVIVQDRGEALVLNEVGSRILELADGRRRLPEIVEVLFDEFEASRDELERDVEGLLSELRRAGVLESDPPDEVDAESPRETRSGP